MLVTAGLQLVIKVKRALREGKIPTRVHQYDAGLDLYASKDTTLTAKQVTIVTTDTYIELPPGTVGLILDRSSMSKKGIHVFGGVMDSGYRGEYLVGLYNTGDTDYQVLKHDKIAQLVIFPIVLAEPYEVNELTTSDRGENNYGSSGR